jgi:hypothetical protein
MIEWPSCAEICFLRISVDVSDGFKSPTVLTPPASESHLGVGDTYRERDWTVNLTARWGDEQPCNARGAVDPLGRDRVLQAPERWAKLSEVGISNKMQELSGITGLRARLAVPPYSELRSPNVSGLGGRSYGS